MDSWVEDLFELFARGKVGKNTPSQFIAIESAIRADDFPTKHASNFSQGWLAHFDNAAGQFVGIEQRDLASPQELGASGFAHADAAGQTEEFHNVRSTFRTEDR